MKILHLDIETAPNKGYFWGLFNQNISINQIEEPGYTLCWSAKWHDKRKIFFDSLQDSTMKNMLESIHTLLDEADAVVHYNGTKFDIPVLNKEFIKYNLPPPSPYHQIDLYRTVKASFRFASNKLDHVCQELGLGAKVQHKGMELWDGCMAGDPKSWKIMERYNKQDVRLLPRLYERLLPWIKDHPNHALFLEDTRPICSNCGSVHVVSKGKETTKSQIYERFKCVDCGTPLRGRTTILPKEKKDSVLTRSKL